MSATISRRRQREHEARTVAAVGVEVKASVHGAGEALAQGEAEPQARRGVGGLLYRLREGFEQPRLAPAGDARAVVADGQSNVTIGAGGGEVDRRAVSARRILAGVVDEVEEDLFQA